MDFYLLDPAGPELRLPVNPSEVNIRHEKKYETINIINMGEVDFPQGEKVKEITFSSFFPNEYDPSYCNYSNIPNPDKAMNMLDKWTNSQEPVRLIITETNINLLVLISAHYPSFKGEDPGDIYFDLTCRTWRDVNIKRVGEDVTTLLPGHVLGTYIRPDTKPVHTTYIVKPGDSLWKIAKLQLKSGSYWRKIYEIPENKKTIGPDYNLIKTGMKLVMPSA